MSEPSLTPSRLWKRMTADERLHVAQAFWLGEDAVQDHMQAVLLISQLVTHLSPEQAALIHEIYLAYVENEDERDAKKKTNGVNGGANGTANGSHA